MKRIIFLAIVLIGMASCEKESEFQVARFPGFTGAGTEAIWVVFGHVVTDVPYVTNYLSKLTPPVRYSFYDSSYVLARQKEVSPHSYKFLESGEVAIIGKGTSNENIWVRQPSLSWEDVEGNLFLYKFINNVKTNVAVGFPDGPGLLMRYKKSYFGDTSADKERYVQEVLYTMFK